jgi:hypothetical protein
MADPKVLELSVQNFGKDKLEIKVKNISGVALERALSMEFRPPSYLVNKEINDAAKAAAKNKKPIGVKNLANIVSGPTGWSVWAKLESSRANVLILFFNDLDQNGNDLSTPIKLAAGSEFTISLPLNAEANRQDVSFSYSYQYGVTKQDKRVDGTLALDEDVEWQPNVSLTTNEESPTGIKERSLVKIFWHVEDGISATLLGPLPSGNSKMELESGPHAEFKISDGSLEVLVVTSMTFILQAEVKPPGKKKVQIVRMLTLDTRNEQFSYLCPRPGRVLPYGLIEIDWAAWGVKDVMISVSGHSTRTIDLTRQTLGRFYEGSGVMRIVATKEIEGERTRSEQIKLTAPPEKPQTEMVEVVPWMSLTTTPKIEGTPVGLAVIAPKIALLTDSGLYIAHVGEGDSGPPTKLAFSLKATSAPSTTWSALAAVDERFVCLRMIFAGTADLELAPFTVGGNPDEIPPVTLPAAVRPLAFGTDAVLDFVGHRGRAYFVAEASMSAGRVRRAWSVAFDNKKADLRPEPLLEPLIGYRLVSFDNGLYALNRNSGWMFRFDLKDGALDGPKRAASAVRKGHGAKEESMVKDGVFAPLRRMLVVLSPSSVPSVASLESFGLQNTLPHSTDSSGPDDPDPDEIPQDLVYNPYQDYWARCGHDLDVKADARVAFRGGQSARLWVIHPDNRVQTLAAGTESLFSPTYVRDFTSLPLPFYLDKTRQFKIKNSTGLQLLPLNQTLHNAGLNDFGIAGPAELTSPLPDTFPSGTTKTFEFKYNEADPVPINLRFMLASKAGVKHQYLLEVTFSGPDLANAESVFKRVILNERGSVLSIANISGTLAKHSKSDAIDIAPPKLLIEGVKLRASNSTTYQFWREAPEAQDRLERSNRYFGDEIEIAYDSPAFFLSAYGAGELHVNVDFALPAGIEISSGQQRQLKLIRIDTDKSKGLHPELLPNKNDSSYECKISYLLKRELKFVYIGDGVAREDGKTIYLPVAQADIQAVTKVLKIAAEDLSVTESSPFIPSGPAPGAFASPNSIAISKQFVYAIFGDTEMHMLDFSLQVYSKLNVGDVYAVVTGIKSAYEPECYLLGIKKDKTSVQNISVHHVLTSKLISKGDTLSVTNKFDISLDSFKGFREQNRMAGYPAWVSSKTVSPMTISPARVKREDKFIREVAVCIEGGLFVVGGTDRQLALESAAREEAIVFGREGKTIYCLHSQGDNQGLLVSRIDNQSWKRTHSLSLPRGEEVVDLTTDTRQRQPGIPYKNHRSTSMVIAQDESLLFVTHGRSIFKIDAAKMELRETYKMELPCRVFHVWSGKPTEESHIVYGTPNSCTLLYAIGASYRGNGIEGRESKTQLYKLAIPDK